MQVDRRHQLGAVIFLHAICALPAVAVRVGPPIYYETPAWRISAVDSLLLEIPFRFIPAEGSAQTPEFLRGARAENSSFLTSDWRIAAPDRNDRFSIRWLGYWTPAETDCEIRLTADEAATFYLDGMKALACVEGTTQSEGPFAFGSRPHELRVEYSDRTGESFVKLEARFEEGDWKSVVVETDRKKGSAVGWKADYYLGENSDTKAFSRIDSTIDFDWGSKSPFDRAEDLPTLVWKTVNDTNGRTCGEIAANRKGTLILDLSLPAGASPRNASLSFANPLLQFSGELPGETVSIQFDREAANFSLGESTKKEEGLVAGRLEFFLRAGDTIHFWEKGGELNDGAQVAKAIELSERAYQGSRPRLGGVGSAWDETLIGSGSWWLQVLADGLSSPKLDRAVVGRLARLVAPDLASALENPSTQSEASRHVVEGLNAAVTGYLAVESMLRENPQGGLDILFGQRAEGEFRAERWPLGGDRFDIQCTANGLRIADSTGTFLAFDSPGTINGFRVDSSGNWIGEVAMKRPAILRAGPAGRVSGVQWNEAPLMLLREGERYQTRLPSVRGSFQLRLRKE